MPRFLIEVPHEEEIVACAKAVQVFLASGSHFLTHADWGCLDGDHRAWIIVDVDSRDEAKGLLPPAFRSQARIVALNQWSMEHIDEIMSRHRP